MQPVKINWGEEQSPNEECRYNHIKGATPLGTYLISWKGWKETPTYDVVHDPFGWCGWSDSIAGIKLEAQKRFDETVMNCIENN